MTTATTIDAPTTPNRTSPAHRASIVALGRIEARRHLRSAPVWLGLAASVYFARNMTAVDWQSGVYSSFPLVFVPFAAGAFVTGVRSGGRDRHPDLPPLAEESPLDGDRRVAARLLGMLPLVALAAVAAAALAIGVRIEGGQWVGDEPGRTDTAVHTLPEILQPVLLVALAAVAGVALGRTFRRRTPVAVLGVVVLLALGGTYWIWQGEPARYLTPVQSQPIEVRIADWSADSTTFPDEWLLSAPDEYDDDWDRVIVHVPMAAWHDVYVGGLTLALVGAARRARAGRVLLAIGIAVAVVGVIAQVSVAPDVPTDVAAPVVAVGGPG